MPTRSAAASPDAPQTLVPVFDPGVLQALFDGDAAVIGAVLDTFGASMASHLDQLQHELGRGDTRAVAGVAHRVKGAARMSGASALAQAAERLEQVAHAGTGPADLSCASADLLQQWQRLQQAPTFKCRAPTGP